MRRLVERDKIFIRPGCHDAVTLMPDPVLEEYQ